MLIGGIMVDKKEMTQFFKEKLVAAKIPENIQQAILASLASLEDDAQTRIFSALHLYVQALTLMEIERATRTLYYEGGLQYLLLTKCGLQDPIVSQILSVFSGEMIVSSSGK